MVRCRAFTLTEVLVVVAIIATLAGLLVPGIALLRQTLRKTQTAALCSAVATALAANATASGRAAPLAPHPLAGSRDLPRLAFVRGEAVAGLAEGDAVATAGEALLCATPGALGGAPAALLLPSDRFAATLQPLLFGLRRDELTIVGSGAGLVRHRLLPAVSPATDQDADTILDPPYDASRYPNNRYLVTDASSLADLDAESAKVLEVAFAANDLQELVAKRSLLATTGGTAIGNGRLYRSGSDTATAWAPGLVQEAGAWVGYRLRGSALYDSWGRELLVRSDAAGAITVSSAGPDGVFRWHPGDDGILQTAATATAPAGDDRDGARDNIGSR
jgi:prepilin-type N-terminal cleavage/methylation domain-containing protein